jgi:SAM-dependent methyltransferase
MCPGKQMMEIMTTTHEPYTVLSKLYDRWMSDIDYQQLTEFILKQCPPLNAQPVSCLDVCCGTGNLMALLAEAGMNVTGIDLSSEMLDIARAKLKRRFGVEQANLHRVDVAKDDWPGGPFDLVVCTFDSASYFPPSELSALIRRAAQTLKPQGLFLFDVNSEYKLRNIFGNSVYGETFEDYAYIWKNNLSEEDRRINYDITMFLSKEDGPGGCYARHLETHVQYLHAQDFICDELRKAGFGPAEMTDNYSEEKVHEQSLRIVFKARKGN